MSLHDVKIRSKLTLTIAIFIVLMIFSSGLSLLSLSRANTGIQTIVNNDYPTTVKANDLIESFQEFVNTQQLMLLDEAGAFRQKSEKHLAEISAHITALLADLNKSSTDAASQKALRELADIRKEYLDSRFRIFTGGSTERSRRRAAGNDVYHHPGSGKIQRQGAGTDRYPEPKDDFCGATGR
ncbi:Four helix bundle sensory module for signal transduction [Cedecea neteri]|uniref:Four helix bundle sensory module for signal transduction n=1 Tax=Cedecea neteri TaxID=158822 RepID=A0A2X3IEC6_9ENTR|nr:Four helix bundle sensory module for signal transduction [Cedecea neteri]